MSRQSDLVGLADNATSLETLATGPTADIVAVGDAYSAGALSNRNKIINGSFQIWQRGTSFTSDAYTADRWYMSLGGSTGTVSQQSFTVGQTDVPDEPSNYLRFNISSYVAEFNLFQRIEDVRTFAGQTAVLSFYMKADSALTVSPFMVQNFGSGGSSNVNAALSTISVTTSWQRFEITISVPSISGKTIGSSSYLQIMPLRVISSFTGNIDIAQVQLEVGDTATPYENRSYGDELLRCCRYYQKAQGMWGWTYNSSAAVFSWKPAVPFRASPSMGLTALASVDQPAIMNRTQSSFLFYTFNWSGNSGDHLNFQMDSFSGLNTNVMVHMRSSGGVTTWDAEL